MSNNDLAEQLDFFDWFKDAMETSIHGMFCDIFNIEDEDDLDYSSISCFPIYTRCSDSGSKILKTLHVKYDCDMIDYIVLSIDEIEKTGATWHEFLDFILLSDVKFVHYKDIM